MSDKRMSNNQMKINDLNECLTFFIIELINIETKKRIIEKDE